MQANTAHNSHANAWVRVVVARSILIDGKSRRVKLLMSIKSAPGGDKRRPAIIKYYSYAVSTLEPIRESSPISAA
jgi:hypothetical protein